MAVHFFTSRAGGVSAPPYAENNLAFHVGDERTSVLENRRLLQNTLGPTVFMNQTHGDTVAVVEGWSENEPRADSLITQTPGIFLAVLTADCVPLLLWDRDATCVAAVHVGRRGLLNEIAVKTISIMRALGAGEISAVLGPSICGSCYEVGADVYFEVVSRFPLAKAQTPAGTLALDLSAALVNQLTDVGVKSVWSRECTVESKTLFSYRRDGATGRFAGVVAL